MNKAISARVTRLERASEPTSQLIVVTADMEREEWPKPRPGCEARYLIIDTGVQRNR